ncbi:MAG: GyrI-like domain-containing protein, partial [Actinomycetia bacterium]|nr:GyrI-like domain-containing protein [Actinomycetes bacterium]
AATGNLAASVERSLILQQRPSIEIIEKPLPAVRLAAGTGVVAEQPEVAGVVGPLFDKLGEVLADAGASLKTPIAQYDVGGSGLRITAGYAYDGAPLPGTEIIELAPIEYAICGIHLGSMDRIAESWQAIHAAIIARGRTPNGACRELYVRTESEDQSDWVTELQQPVSGTDGAV